MRNGRFDGGAFLAGMLLLNPFTLSFTYAGSIIAIKTYVETLDLVVTQPTEQALTFAGADSETAGEVGVGAGIVAGVLIPLLLYWFVRSRLRGQQ